MTHPINRNEHYIAGIKLLAAPGNLIEPLTEDQQIAISQALAIDADSVYSDIKDEQHQLNAQ